MSKSEPAYIICGKTYSSAVIIGLSVYQLSHPVRPKYRPAGLWFISVKQKYRAGNYDTKIPLKIVLCPGAPGLETPCCGSSGVRGLIQYFRHIRVLNLTHRKIVFKKYSTHPIERNTPANPNHKWPSLKVYHASSKIHFSASFYSYWPHIPPRLSTLPPNKWFLTCLITRYFLFTCLFYVYWW